MLLLKGKYYVTEDRKTVVKVVDQGYASKGHLVFMVENSSLLYNPDGTLHLINDAEAAANYSHSNLEYEYDIKNNKIIVYGESNENLIKVEIDGEEANQGSDKVDLEKKPSIKLFNAEEAKINADNSIEIACNKMLDLIREYSYQGYYCINIYNLWQASIHYYSKNTVEENIQVFVKFFEDLMFKVTYEKSSSIPFLACYVISWKEPLKV